MTIYMLTRSALHCTVVLVCCAAGKGATVIQLGGGTRELYYYPKNTMTVINVGENVNKGKMHMCDNTHCLLACCSTQHAPQLCGCLASCRVVM
jgi:hypothetical protein